MTIKYTEINNPDVVGWEWQGVPWITDDGVKHEGLAHSLTWDRHNHTFMYSTKGVTGEWSHIQCRGDYWLGRDTIAKARELAADFIAMSEED